jgi:hypothetical protein
MNLIDLFTRIISVAVVLAVLYYLFDMVTKDEDDNPDSDIQND